MNTTNNTYRILTLIALSGECSTDAVPLLGIRPSYCEKLITGLKEENYIKTHYKDRLRGYRLTSKGKKLLLSSHPDRFLFYLSGNSDTNRLRSDYARRIRLQNTSMVYAMLMQSGIHLFRDEKPLIFQTGIPYPVSLPLPVFYHSREIKELGIETVKINNSRIIGILLTKECVYAVFYTGNALMKWEYQTEIRLKAFLKHHINSGILSGSSQIQGFRPDAPIKALVIGSDMDTAVKLMHSNGGYQRSYFHLDSSFDYFHYLPASPAGEIMLQLLCDSMLQHTLRSILLSDLDPCNPDLGVEHDAVWNTLPLQLAFDFDMLRLSRFHTALSFHGICGRLICFDFQKSALQQYFGNMVTIETIDLYKFERRFFTDGN